MPLVDAFGRAIRYLRLSVTDRCTFRCTYCRPAEGVSLAPHKHLLTLEEVLRLTRLFCGLGIRRIRLTGGEPLVRRNIARLVYDLKRIPELEELSLSTNACLLPSLAKPLKDAGLDRVNISLDSLNPETFRSITRGGDLESVLAGIDAAVAAGLTPVKVNMVVMRGLNDHEIADMIRFAVQRKVVLRFIETMPVGNPGSDAVHYYMSAEEILNVVRDAAGSSLTPSNVEGAGPARYFKVDGVATSVGVISALSQHFCEGCNRMRLTSKGNLVLCLGRDDRVDLRTPLRAGCSDSVLQQAILDGVARKPRRHSFEDPEQPVPEHRMSALGG